MPKFLHDDVIDAGPNMIKNNVTRLVACSAYPTTFNEANSTYALADVTVASGDFTVANGDSSGRKVTVAQKDAVTVDANGTATHLAGLDVANSKVIYVTTTPSQAVVTGGTVDFGSHKIEFSDPS